MTGLRRTNSNSEFIIKKNTEMMGKWENQSSDFSLPMEKYVKLSHDEKYAELDRGEKFIE